MNTDQLLDVASYAGKLLIESGAEIYRVEETMVRLCTYLKNILLLKYFLSFHHKKSYPQIVHFPHIWDHDTK